MKYLLEPLRTDGVGKIRAQSSWATANVVEEDVFDCCAGFGEMS